MGSPGPRQFATICFLLTSGCGGGDEGREALVVCTADVRAGISIRVFDAVTGNPAACGARATVTAPGFSETEQPIGGTACRDDFGIGAVYERPGTYSVVVSKAGYQDFHADNIVVGKTADGCHVITVAVDARLSP